MVYRVYIVLPSSLSTCTSGCILSVNVLEFLDKISHSKQLHLQDYILAKEYRGMGHYRPGACVPALELAQRNLKIDRRSEPRPGERVPYVVVYGHPGQPLIQVHVCQ